MVREECRRGAAGGQVWRSPDILLRGFRNRQLHGLIDWRLGLELLRVMQDPAFMPGRDQFFEGWDLGLASWGEQASALADTYCEAYEKGTATRVDGPGNVHGWTSVELVAGGERKVLYLVSHPLWAATVTASGPIGSSVVDWARTLGATTICLLDSFNLSRRMAWVRGNLPTFPIVDVELVGVRADGGTGASPIEAWMRQLVAMPEGEVLAQDGWRWTRVRGGDAWTAAPGIWLADVGGQLSKVNVSNYPGAGLRIKVVGSASPALDRLVYPALPLIARRSEEKDA
jgi:hypothetical protein